MKMGTPGPIFPGKWGPNGKMETPYRLTSASPDGRYPDGYTKSEKLYLFKRLVYIYAPARAYFT